MKKILATGIIAISLLQKAEARPIETYIPDWAVSYAHQWVANGQSLRNPSYVYFSSDCTNFASQTLRSGGWSNTMIGTPQSDAYWYYVSSAQYSQTWSVANALYRHFANGYEGWTGGAFIPSVITYVNYGDIIFADWEGDGTIDHSMIVTGFRRKSDGTLEPRLSYHSTDREDSWSDFLALIPIPYKVPKTYKFSKTFYAISPLPSQIF